MTHLLILDRPDTAPRSNGDDGAASDAALLPRGDGTGGNAKRSVVPERAIKPEPRPARSPYVLFMR
jgi:hypothetical protein